MATQTATSTARGAAMPVVEAGLRIGVRVWGLGFRVYRV